MKDLLDRNDMEFFTLENVDMDAGNDDSPSNFNIIVQTLESSGKNGFIVRVYKLCTKDYGLPQRRVRLFFVGLNKNSQDESSFRDIEKWLTVFQLPCQPPDWNSVSSP